MTSADAPILDDGQKVRARRIRQCRRLIQERRIILQALRPELCLAPAWDILLDLYLAELEERPIYLWQSCVASNIPISSAHRKISHMIESGIVERTGLGSDRRCVDIALSPATRGDMHRLVDALTVIPCRPS
jgi:hypothetical protein